MCEEEDMFPPLTIKTLIEMVKKCNEEGFKIYHKGALINYSFEVNPAAQTQDIDLIESECEVILPTEYKDFLLLADGMLFGNYECQICSVEQVIDYYYSFEDIYPSNMLVIAHSAGASVHILMQINDDGYKLYTTQAIGDERLWLYNDNLLNFFDNFISTYGFPFWNIRKDESTALLKLNAE